MDLIFMLYSQFSWLYFFILALFSLLVGSFLNVLIHRLPIMLERSWQQEYSDIFRQKTKQSQKKKNPIIFFCRAPPVRIAVTKSAR